MIHIWKTQKNIKNLQLDFTLNAPSIVEIVRHHTPIFQDFRSLTELNIDFGVEEDQSSIQSLLNIIALRTIENICLFTSVDAEPTIQERVFGSHFLSNNLPSANLKHITLGGFHLPESGNWELHKYDHLESLKLYSCCNLAPTLDSFTDPTLKYLVIQFAANVSDVDFSSVASLVGRIRGLETLIFDNHKAFQNNPETTLSRRTELIAAIASSRKTLAHLLLDGMGHDTCGVSLWDELQLCTRLRHLALELDIKGHCKVCHVYPGRSIICG